MRFHIESYGCTMNHGEAEFLRRRLLSMGHTQIDGTAGMNGNNIPDLNIIFTCVVIRETERRMFRRAKEFVDSGCPLLISGCMVTAFPDKSREIAPKAMLIPPDQLFDLDFKNINEWLDPGEKGYPVTKDDLEENRNLSMCNHLGKVRARETSGNQGKREYSVKKGNQIEGGKLGDNGHTDESGGLEQAEGSHDMVLQSSPSDNQDPGCRIPLDGIFEEGVAETRNRTTFIVPISQGCLGNCAYCITKIARGRLRSYGPSDITRMVENAVGDRYREIQITSQDTGIYGRDIAISLPELMNHLADIPGEFRIRIGMMNPSGLGTILDDLIHAYSRDKIFKFLHLPVQSADDTILRSMKRGHTIAEFKTIVNEFRKVFPDMVLSTDIIVGYPGEDEISFRKDIDLLKDIRADLVNITRYSERPGTSAVDLPEKVHGRISKERSRELSELRFRISREINAGYINSTLRVLVTEKGKPGSVICRDDNYRTVVLKEDIPVGVWHEVEIVDSTDVYLLGKRIW